MRPKASCYIYFPAFSVKCVSGTLITPGVSGVNALFFHQPSDFTTTSIGSLLGPMASLSQLPVELVEYIYTHLPQSALYAAARVNKGSNALAVPFLYRHVDLFIQPGDKIPRIDRFCMNVMTDPRLAAHIATIRLGPSSSEGVKEGQRWLPRDAHFDDRIFL